MTMNTGEKEYIGLRKYAERIGCDVQIISRAIASGAIPAEAIARDPNNGRPRIDLVMAEEAWGNSYRLTRRNTKKRRYGADEPEVITATAPPEKRQSPPRPPAGVGPAMPALPLMPENLLTLDYKQADLYEKIADMQIKQLKAAEMQGELVRADAIEKVFYDFARSVRNGFQNIADRVIDPLLTAPSRNEAHILLQKEIDSVLQALATPPEYRTP